MRPTLFCRLGRWAKRLATASSPLVGEMSGRTEGAPQTKTSSRIWRATMDSDDVRIFLATARAGQILGAGGRLELNHATVSRRVAALEDALGAKMFRRLTTGSVPATAGERFPRRRRARGGPT